MIYNEMYFLGVPESMIGIYTLFKCTCPITKGAEVVLSLCWTCRGVKALNKMKSVLL